MILRVITHKIHGDYGQVWISEAIALSKPDGLLKVRSLFERMTTPKRRCNSAKGLATRMGLKFAKGLS